MLEADDDDGVVSTEAPPKSMCGRTFACLDLVLDKTSPPLAPYRLPLVLFSISTQRSILRRPSSSPLRN